MQVGLLWFDNDPGRGVNAKIQDAAQRYREKFGVAPDTCYVNCGVLGGQGGADLSAGLRLRVVPVSNILPHHFWVGMEEKAG